MSIDDIVYLFEFMEDDAGKVFLIQNQHYFTGNQLVCLLEKQYKEFFDANLHKGRYDLNRFKIAMPCCERIDSI